MLGCQGPLISIFKQVRWNLSQLFNFAFNMLEVLRQNGLRYLLLNLQDCLQFIELSFQILPQLNLLVVKYLSKLGNLGLDDSVL